MRAFIPILAIALTACAELSTVHYVNPIQANYESPATGYRDTDGDGVMDFADMCPRTQPGTRVAADGCVPVPQNAIASSENCDRANATSIPSCGTDGVCLRTLAAGGD